MDQCEPTFFPEQTVEPMLLGPKGTLSKVGCRIDIVGAYPEGCAQNRLVEDGRTSVYKEMAALRCLHNIAQVSSIDPLNHQGRVLTKKGASTDEITIAAQYLMTLANQ